MEMMILSNFSVVDTFLLTITILLSTTYYFAFRKHDYFKKRGIKYIKPLPFFGNTIDVAFGRKHTFVCQKEIYEKLDGERFCGVFLYTTPYILIRDPELIQQVLIKDFQHFFDRGNITDFNVDPLNANLSNLEGQEWKALRQKLTPAFSSGKINGMFEQFNECADGLLSYIKEDVNKNATVDVLQAMRKFSVDVIGSCGFGLQLNSLKDPNSEFRRMSSKIFLPSFRFNIRALVRIIDERLPFLFGIKQFPKEGEDFFLNLVKEMIDYRKREHFVRNDFIQILISLINDEAKMAKKTNKTDNEVQKNTLNTEKAKIDNDCSHGVMLQDSSSPGDKNQHSSKHDGYQLEIDDKLLAANTFAFFLAAFESSSCTLTYCLLELAANEAIQTKLRNEVIAVSKKFNNKVTSESLKEMHYLDLVLTETLRKHPPVGSFRRKCTIPYKIPGTSVEIQKDEKLLIPVFGLHHDPKYYPEPEIFDPERFNDDNKMKRPSGTYIPFGTGPRFCIGMRFVLMEIKVALTKLLLMYSFKLNPKTKLPIKYAPWKFVLTPDSGIWLNVTPIKNENNTII